MTRALEGGVATLDALAARTGEARDPLLWALEEAVARGWVSASGEGCGRDGICASGAPVIYALTQQGRATIRR